MISKELLEVNDIEHKLYIQKSNLNDQSAYRSTRKCGRHVLILSSAWPSMAWPGSILQTDIRTDDITL